MRRMNCIACNIPLDPFALVRYCNQCDIYHYTLFSIRQIYSYDIEWSNNHTFIFSRHSGSPKAIKSFVGYKLFDVRTVEQIEKLLILL
jgi:hypothetical protein